MSRLSCHLSKDWLLMKGFRTRSLPQKLLSESWPSWRRRPRFSLERPKGNLLVLPCFFMIFRPLSGSLDYIWKTYSTKRHTVIKDMENIFSVNWPKSLFNSTVGSLSRLSLTCNEPSISIYRSIGAKPLSDWAWQETLCIHCLDDLYQSILHWDNALIQEIGWAFFPFILNRWHLLFWGVREKFVHSKGQFFWTPRFYSRPRRNCKSVWRRWMMQKLQVRSVFFLAKREVTVFNNNGFLEF